MARLIEIQARIGSIEELLEIVGAMRSLAAVRVQQGQSALSGIREYTDVVGHAIARTVAEMGSVAGPARGEPRARSILVFCSEHGFVGGFNERLLDRAAELAKNRGHLCVVGGRGALLAEEKGIKPLWTVPMATHAGGVLETARRTATELFRRIGRGESDSVAMIYARYESGGRSSVVVEPVLPLDLSAFGDQRTGPAPLHNLPLEELLEKLAGEFVLAELARAAMESFASENGARLRAMESAHDNIEEKLGDLRQAERRLRQEESTAELLDVVTGAEALLGRSRARKRRPAGRGSNSPI
ncbi:MAG: FoF1 ATP synthase subunit gamma [Alphaproteobacteria bacterium]